MPKLKSHQQAPPEGFRFQDRHTKWKNWDSAPNTVWDFSSLCAALQQHRIANLKKFPYLKTDMAGIIEEVDRANAERVSAIRGAESYIIQDGGGVPPKQSALHNNPVVAVVGQLKQVSAGAAVLLDWERSGEPPVPPDLSAMRAFTCTHGGPERRPCPRNSKGDWTRLFTVPVSQIIQRQMERAREVDLSTPNDAELGVCAACSCPLKLKVHAPLKFVLDHLTEESRALLTPYCWMKNEKL